MYRRPDLMRRDTDMILYNNASVQLVRFCVENLSHMMFLIKEKIWICCNSNDW